MNTFEILLLSGGIAVGIAGISILWHAISLRRRV